MDEPNETPDVDIEGLAERDSYDSRKKIDVARNGPTEETDLEIKCPKTPGEL